MKTLFIEVSIPVTRVSMHEGKVDLVLVGAARLQGGKRPITPQSWSKRQRARPVKFMTEATSTPNDTTYNYRIYLKYGSFFYYDMVTNTIPSQ